jgi:hypothetical protein
MGKVRDAYQFLVEKSKLKGLIVSSISTPEDSIKIHLKHIFCEIMDWLNVVQDRHQWQAGSHEH